MDPKLQIARAAMQPVLHLDSRVGKCVDANRAAFSYAAYYVCRTIYKMWPSTIKWMTMPYELMQERFRTGSRYDAMGNWPGPLCTTDPETNVSRDITDEEIRTSSAHAGGDLEDPDRHWLIRKFRTNQVLSSLTRGADQLGYGRQAFNPKDIPRREGDALLLPWTLERDHPESHRIHNVFPYSPSLEPCNGLPVHRSSGMCPGAKHEGNNRPSPWVLDRSRHPGSGQVRREDKQTQD